MTKFSTFPGATTKLPTQRWGVLTLESVFLSGASDGDLVVWFGDTSVEGCPLVRIHSECLFGEVLGSVTCDCGLQLQLAMEELAQDGGLLIYLREEARGAGLSAKVAATALELEGVDTSESRTRIGVAPDSRDFSRVADFLLQKGISSVRLLTNNPAKVGQLEQAGILVHRRPLVAEANNIHLEQLYSTKQARFGHFL